MAEGAGAEHGEDKKSTGNEDCLQYRPTVEKEASRAEVPHGAGVGRSSEHAKNADHCQPMRPLKRVNRGVRRR